MIGLKFSDQVTKISQVLVDEFQQLVAGIRGYLFVEHKDDGTHGDVTADSVTTDTLTADTATIEHFTSDDATLEGTFVGAATLQQLRLTPQFPVSVAFAETALAIAASASLYYLTSSGDCNVYGLFCFNVSTGEPGQVAILHNTSGHTITFNSSLVTNAQRIYGCTVPVAIQNGGSICFIYDDANKGWRYAWSSPGAPAAYTPVWTATSVNPALGDGSLSGVWSQQGSIVTFQITLTIGSTTTLGTGLWEFTLPTAAAAVDQITGGLSYTGTFNPLAGRTVAGDKVRAYGPGGADAVDATRPAAWLAGHTLWISGSYRRA